ncbi:MAG: DUF1801 domain-containing protein [Bacteroidetes bacterium]|nr:DUF1801 domain-containing protein [Bacteroidota bacterium]
MMIKFQNVDDYIASFPDETQVLLIQMRATILKAAPKALEGISYGMPAYKFHGVLVYFAGYKKHIGFYPSTSGIANFQQEIAMFKNSKGAIQFPLSKPLPLKLVTTITKFRAAENLAKTR